MGCAFSQGSDRRGRSSTKAYHHQSQLQPQRLQQQQQQQQQQHSYQRQHTDHSFAPASITPRSTSTASTGAPAVTSNYGRGTSPEKEEDMHFRRQHFDRNSVLRHSKKRTRKAAQSSATLTSNPASAASVTNTPKTERASPSERNGTNGLASSQPLESTPIRRPTREDSKVSIRHYTEEVSPVKIVTTNDNTELVRPKVAPAPPERKTPVRRALTAAEIVQDEMSKSAASTDKTPASAADLVRQNLNKSFETDQVRLEVSSTTTNKSVASASTSSSPSAAHAVKALLNRSTDSASEPRSTRSRTRSRSRGRGETEENGFGRGHSSRPPSQGEVEVLNGDEVGRLI